jgi:hypothetical protein
LWFQISYELFFGNTLCKFNARLNDEKRILYGSVFAGKDQSAAMMTAWDLYNEWNMAHFGVPRLERVCCHGSRSKASINCA